MFVLGWKDPRMPSWALAPLITMSKPTAVLPADCTQTCVYIYTLFVL